MRRAASARPSTFEPAFQQAHPADGRFPIAARFRRRAVGGIQRHRHGVEPAVRGRAAARTRVARPAGMARAHAATAKRKSRTVRRAGRGQGLAGVRSGDRPAAAGRPLPATGARSCSATATGGKVGGFTYPFRREEVSSVGERTHRPGRYRLRFRIRASAKGSLARPVARSPRRAASRRLRPPIPFEARRGQGHRTCWSKATDQRPDPPN